MSSPVYARNGIPAIGRVDVYRDGRVILDGRHTLDHRQITALLHVVKEAAEVAAYHAPRPLRRHPEATTRITELANHDC